MDKLNKIEKKVRVGRRIQVCSLGFWSYAPTGRHDRRIQVHSLGFSSYLPTDRRIQVRSLGILSYLPTGRREGRRIQ